MAVTLADKDRAAVFSETALPVGGHARPFTVPTASVPAARVAAVDVVREREGLRPADLVDVDEGGGCRSRST